MIDDFYGTLDGNGFKISNITMENHPEAGLFSRNYGSLRNIKIEDSFFSATTDVAALAIRNYGNIENSYFIGSISVNDGKLGGIVAYNYYGAVVDSCYTAGNFTSFLGLIGGIVATNFGLVKNSYNMSEISAGYSYAGGVSGFNNISGAIETSYNIGIIIGNSYYGGLVGINDGSLNASYCMDNISSICGIGNISGGTIHTSSNLKVDTKLIGFDFANIWFFDIESVSFQYPQLIKNRHSAAAPIDEKLPDGERYTFDELMSIYGSKSIEIISADGIASPTRIENGKSNGTITLLDTSNTINSLPGLSISTTKLPVKYYDYQIKVRTTQPISKDDVVLITFYARCTEDSETLEQGGGQISTALMEVGGDNTTSGNLVINPGSEWVKYFIPCKISENYPADGATIAFSFGYVLQTVEIAGLCAYNFKRLVQIGQMPITTATYDGQNLDAPWRVDADERINQYRKEDMKIIVKDANGNLVPSANITITNTKSEFNFGSAVNSIFLSNDRSKFEAMFKKYFNLSVLESDDKWYNWVDPLRQANAIEITNWMVNNDIKMRGHTLMWERSDTWPLDIQQAYSSNNQSYILSAINNHFTDILTKNSGKMIEWDVVNEPVDNRKFRDMFGDQILLDFYNKANEIDPNIKLYINENRLEGLTPDKTDRILELVGYLKDNGAPIDGIGNEGHFADYMPPMSTIYEHFMRLNSTGLDLAITEFDVKTADENFRADVTRDMMTMAFSIPNMKSFVFWKTWEATATKNISVMYDYKWNMKKSGLVIEDLILNKWRTNVVASTDESGEFNVRGFLGEYEIKANINGKEITKNIILKKGQANIIEIVE